MCNIIYERYLLAKVYLTKFNDYYALKPNNSCLSKDTFQILTTTYANLYCLYDKNEFPEPILTDIDDNTCWNFFILGDQLLKGAGYNLVQILDYILRK